MRAQDWFEDADEDERALMVRLLSRKGYIADQAPSTLLLTDSVLEKYWRGELVLPDPGRYSRILKGLNQCYHWYGIQTNRSVIHLTYQMPHSSEKGCYRVCANLLTEVSEVPRDFRLRLASPHRNPDGSVPTDILCRSCLEDLRGEIYAIQKHLYKKGLSWALEES